MLISLVAVETQLPVKELQVDFRPSKKPKDNQSQKHMKPKTILTALAVALLAPGALYATTATTTPVGYETLALTTGFNYMGLRLHNSTILAGEVTGISASQLTATGVDFNAALTEAATTYILEFENASGNITQVLGSAAGDTTLTLGEDLTTFVTVGDKFRIRKADTLASVFGATNTAGFAAGFFGPGGADLVYVPDGAGDFDIYYFDDGIPGWADFEGNAVDPALIPLVYTDSLVISATSELSLTVDGEVKTKAVNYGLASGFNYLGSVFPVGSTLASAFGATPASLDTGFFGPGGADLVYIPDGLGDFTIYYYDGGQESWSDFGGNAVDATLISITPGIIISNENAPLNLKISPPTSYSGL